MYPFSTKTSFIALLFTAVLVVSLFAINSGAMTLCDPQNSSTCAFGGRCEPLPNPSGSGILHVCRCPRFSCLDEILDPVCDVHKRTHYNDACRRQAECAEQRRLNVFCTKQCDDNKCIEIETQDKQCPPDRNICLNNGRCLLDNNGEAYCNCLTSYGGSRCETRLMKTIATKTPQGCLVENAGFDYRIAFLCSLGLLGLVGLLHITHCLIKCHSRKKQSHDCKEEISPDSKTQVGEKAGLPDSSLNCPLGSISKSTAVELGV